jgi:hypothetical protein
MRKCLVVNGFEQLLYQYEDKHMSEQGIIVGGQ